MPKIQWAGLPPALRDHLFDRLRERKITVGDLYQLKVWRESEPDAPEGPCLGQVSHTIDRPTASESDSIFEPATWSGLTSRLAAACY